MQASTSQMSAPAREVPNRCRDGTVLQNHQELIRSKAILGTDVLCQERGVVHFGIESRQNAGNLPESFFVERSAERCVAVMRSCRRSPAWARPRCLFWPACNRLAWLSVCGPPLPARDDSPPPDTSVCPPLQVDSSEKACHSRCCLSEASLRASCGPI